MTSKNVNKFTPRLSKPNASIKYYVNYKYGGINTCIVLDKSNGYVLPNCVGYAHGRFLELLEYNKCNWKLPNCNAEDWYEKAISKGFNVGTEPQLGAVVVWGKGKLHTSSDGCGHVAIVEQIKADGTIIVSESGYKSFEFRTKEFKPPYKKSGYTLLGFIYPPIYFGKGELDVQEVTKPKDQTTLHTVVKGDTLSKIAKKYLGNANRYKEIQNLNNLPTTLIRVGQVLKIPIK